MSERLDEAVSKWLEESAPARLPERVLSATFERTRKSRQHVGWRAFLGRPEMFRFATALGSIAVVLVVVAVVGYQLLPGEVGSDGTLLARGSFVTQRGAVELEAFGRGSGVTGHMTVSEEQGGTFTVDLQCNRTTADGLIMIGGLITDSTHPTAPVGTWAAIWLKDGSPVKAELWYLRGGHVIAYAPSCLAGLDAQLEYELSVADSPPDYNLQPIEGTIEIGGSAPPS